MNKPLKWAKFFCDSYCQDTSVLRVQTDITFQKVSKYLEDGDLNHALWELEVLSYFSKVLADREG